MNLFLRFVKKLSLLFGRGRFLSELEEENGISSRAESDRSPGLEDL